MIKRDIALSIAKATGLKQLDVMRVVQMTLDEITNVLEAEGRLELRNFGIFKVKLRKARKARNPRTGETVYVPARKAVVFKPGRVMKKRIAK